MTSSPNQDWLLGVIDSSKLLQIRTECGDKELAGMVRCVCCSPSCESANVLPVRFGYQVVRRAALESSVVLNSVPAVRLLEEAVCNCAENELKDAFDQIFYRLALSLQVRMLRV